MQKHWSGLTVFVDRPEVPMDNNLCNAACGITKVMPTAGLCRGGGFGRARSKVRSVADTA